jgi:hypothetical protein
VDDWWKRDFQQMCESLDEAHRIGENPPTDALYNRRRELLCHAAFAEFRLKHGTEIRPRAKLLMREEVI